MFDSNKIKAMQARIDELETQLREETAAHEADRKAMLAMQQQLALEERSFREMRAACTEKLADMDARTKAYNERIRLAVLHLREKKEQQDALLEREAQLAREALDQEIKLTRAHAYEEMRKRIKAFGDNYIYYLNQIKVMMNTLTRASLNTGATFLTESGGDTDKLFINEMAKKRELAENGASKDATAAAKPKES